MVFKITTNGFSNENVFLWNHFDCKLLRQIYGNEDCGY